MKRIILAIAIILVTFLNNTANAQTDTTKKPFNGPTTISISIPNGIELKKCDTSSKKALTKEEKEKKKEEDDKKFKTYMTMMDLGLNVLDDKTNYQSAGVKNYMHVPAGQQNGSLFNLRQWKSINVNIYPVMCRFRLLKTSGQRIYFSTGLGLQLYNFRYEQPINYSKDHYVSLDTISIGKNKLGMDYLNVPLMFTFKTKIGKKDWLVYGAGLTEGYLISSWTKQVSGARGKVKVHDGFDFADFNTCVTAEIGLEDRFRFYASYQLTSMYKNDLDQHPFSFGVRISGI